MTFYEESASLQAGQGQDEGAAENGDWLRTSPNENVSGKDNMVKADFGETSEEFQRCWDRASENKLFMRLIHNDVKVGEESDADYKFEPEADEDFIRIIKQHFGNNPETVLKVLRESKRNASENDMQDKSSISTISSRCNDIDDDEFISHCAKNDQEGDALLYNELFKGYLLYDHQERWWYIFKENYWEQDKENNVLIKLNKLQEIYKQTAKKEDDKADKASDANNYDDNARKKAEANARQCRNAIKRLNKAPHRKNVLKLAGSGAERLATSGDHWDQGRENLPVSNGIIDLRTLELRRGIPEDMIRSGAPTPFHGMNVEAPHWEKLMRDALPEEDARNCVQRFYGQMLYNDVREHKLAILLGRDGRESKTTFAETLREVLGGLAWAIRPELLLEQDRQGNASSPSPELMALRGKRHVFAEETNEAKKFDSSRVKHLTGGNTITGRAPYGDEINFPPSHSLTLITNRLPSIDQEDSALRERLMIVPFQTRFVDEPVEDNEKKRDPQMREKLKKEAPGILAWLVRGCLEWQKQGLNPPRRFLADAWYLKSQGDVYEFLEDRCKNDPNSEIQAENLYSAYYAWCSNQNVKALSQRKFGQEMKKHYPNIRRNSGFFYQEIKLA